MDSNRRFEKKLFALHGDIDQVRETGDAAWRFMVPADQIYASKDPELIEALESTVAFRWMDPDGQIDLEQKNLGHRKVTRKKW